jgi:hypothetical protein
MSKLQRAGKLSVLNWQRAVPGVTADLENGFTPHPGADDHRGSTSTVTGRRDAWRGHARLGEKIWDGAPHNAFTDLTRYRDEWFCVFRRLGACLTGRRCTSWPEGGDLDLRRTTARAGRRSRDAKITVTGRSIDVERRGRRQPASAKHRSLTGSRRTAGPGPAGDRQRSDRGSGA